MAKSNKYDSYTKEELIDELETLKKKKYGLVWDKKNSQEILDAFVNWENVPENFMPKQFPVLKEVKNKEIKTDKDKPVNLLIEGDNYHSLAVLNFTHQDKIDVVYIDPPYNTGNNDFTFNDKFVDREDPWRHSKWLSFMEKRLWLARSLLKKTGVLFVSIGDDEFAQLKLLCDEIFGDSNFLANIIRKSKETSNKGR
jgi:adenine-specific DNA-methyltransferase